MPDLQGQRIIDAAAAGAVAVSDQVNHVVGAAATLLTKPATKPNFLVLMADTGSFRARLGDRTSAGMPVALDPGASVSDGSGAIKIAQGQTLVLPAPQEITVKGFNAGDVLTYYWV